jgi:hypothetical protein
LGQEPTSKAGLFVDSQAAILAWGAGVWDQQHLDTWKALVTLRQLSHKFFFYFPVI